MLRLGWPNYAATRVDQLCCGSNGLVKVRINNGVSIEQFHKNIFEYINALVFEYCSDITFKNSSYNPLNFARVVEGHLYFTGRLMHIKVYEIIKHNFQSRRAQEWFGEMMLFFPSEQKTHQIREKIQHISTLNPSVYNQLCLYQVAKVAQSYPQPESAIVDRPLSTLRGTLFDFNPDSPVTKAPHHIHQERSLRALGNQIVNVENCAIPHPSSASILSEDEILDREIKNKRIGDRGEEFVFRKIVHLLKKQWGIEPCDVIINDSELGQGINACRFVNASGMQLDLIWYNRDRTDLQTMESPVDMVIAVNGEKRYFIEIKSTASKSYSTFFLTANEWDYMREKREKSILVRAYHVNEVN